MSSGHIVTQAATQNPMYHQLRETPKRRFRCRLCVVATGLAAPFRLLVRAARR